MISIIKIIILELKSVHITELRTLNMGKNHLLSIDLSKNGKLRKLDTSCNRVRMMSLINNR